MEKTKIRLTIHDIAVLKDYYKINPLDEVLMYNDLVDILGKGKFLPYKELPLPQHKKPFLISINGNGMSVFYNENGFATLSDVSNMIDSFNDEYFYPALLNGHKEALSIFNRYYFTFGGRYREPVWFNEEDGCLYITIDDIYNEN